MVGIIMAPVGCAIAIIAPPPAGAWVAIAIMHRRLSAIRVRQDSATARQGISGRPPAAATSGHITSTREQLRHLPGHLCAIYCLQSRLDYWLRLLPTATSVAAHAAQAGRRSIDAALLSIDGRGGGAARHVRGGRRYPGRGRDAAPPPPASVAEAGRVPACALALTLLPLT
jgi:hypothetical protein